MANDVNLLVSEIEGTRDADQVDKVGRTLLMWATLEGNENIVKALLCRGATIDAKDKENSYTALHFAAQEQSERIISMLCEAGANPNSRDKFGNTPLSRATFSSRGRGEAILELLRCGADPKIKNKFGVSPYELAAQIGNYDIIQFFK